MAAKAATQNQESTKEYNPWEDMREVFIPRASGESATEGVSINDRSYAIPKNQRVMVPYPVYEVIQNKLRQMRDNEKYARQAFPVCGIDAGKL